MVQFKYFKKSFEILFVQNIDGTIGLYWLLSNTGNLF